MMIWSSVKLFLLVLVSLVTISKAGFGDFFNNIGDAIKDTYEDVVDGIKDVGSDIGNSIDDKITDIIVGVALPDGAADLFKDVNSLLDQARTLRQQGTNFTTQKIEIYDIFNGANQDQLCGHCIELVDDLKDKTDDSDSDNSTEKAFLDIFFTLCEEFFDQKYCSEAVQDVMTSLFASLVNPAVNSTWACQRLAMCPYLINNDTLNPFLDSVLQDKPVTNTSTTISANRSTYQVLHMTDIHIDFQYQEGTWAKCGGFMCCRADSGPSPDPNDPFETAGHWGGLGICDLPPRTYEQFLRFASSNFNFSFILWTGDNIDHEVWAQSQATQLNPTENATAYLQQYFPNTTIYPMFGNHENFFTDQFDTVGNSDDWLKTELGTIWQSLFTQESLNEFTTNSYYSTVNEEHNLKIISLDTQTCDTLNFLLIRENNVDPLNQLAWLRDELLDAENNNLTVFIMGHISPGDLNCDAQWSARYRALVDRFTNVIKGQFFGHTHTDHFQVVRSHSEGNPPVGVIYMAPSLSTYTELNPSFRVFDIDSETNEVVNFRQYRLNLTKWNQNTTGPIEWDLAYSFLEEYGLNDTSNESVDNLVERIRTDNATADTYLYNYYSGVPHRYNITQRSIDFYYCSAKYAQSHNIMNCMGLDPAKTNLLYFAGEFGPGVIDETNENNNNN